MRLCLIGRLEVEMIDLEVIKMQIKKSNENHTVMALKVCNKLPGHIFDLDKLSLKRLVSDWLTHKSFYNINEFFYFGDNRIVSISFLF